MDLVSFYLSLNCSPHRHFLVFDKLTCSPNEVCFDILINNIKDTVWQPFSQGKRSRLYRERLSSKISDPHLIILFWKQAWNIINRSVQKRNKGYPGGCTMGKESWKLHLANYSNYLVPAKMLYKIILTADFHILREKLLNCFSNHTNNLILMM